MSRFLLRRVLLGLLILLLVSIVVFAATQALPGNAARAILGRNATPARLAALTRQLHLNESARVAVLALARRDRDGQLRDLGRHSAAGQPAAVRRGSTTRRSWCWSRRWWRCRCRSCSGCGWRSSATSRPTTSSRWRRWRWPSLPEFVIGIGLILLFATNLSHVFPAVSIIPPGEHAWNVPKAVVLPAATLVLAVDAVHQPDHARLDGRGAGVRVRDDGAAEGPVRTGR